jgi:hypothetical protein
MSGNEKRFTAKTPRAPSNKAENRNLMATQDMIFGFVQDRFLSNVLLGALGVLAVKGVPR